jgi:hypothetical protein
LATTIIFSAAALPPLINADLAPSACAIANMNCFERAPPGASLHWLQNLTPYFTLAAHKNAKKSLHKSKMLRNN